jgi:four helix bundle protein
MATVKRFEDLEVWKLARKVANEVYGLSKEGEFGEDYALRNQIRRSAISIISNIAEGFEAGTDKQFSRYLRIAKGSAGECRAQLYVALDQHYISQNKFNRLKEKLIICSRKLSKLISYLDGSNNQVRDIKIIYEA